MEILEVCTAEELNEKEIYWIKFFNTFQNGYNQTLGGQNMTPNCLSEEAKQKMITTLKNNPNIYGENHHASKLTNEEVVKIRQRFKDGESVSEIYENYKHIYKNMTNLRDVIQGRTYSIAGNIPSSEELKRITSCLGENNSQAKLKQEEIISIRQRYIDGESIENIFKDYKDKYSEIGYFKKIIIGKVYNATGPKDLIVKCNVKYDNEQKENKFVSAHILLSNEELISIRKRYLAGELPESIYEDFKGKYSSLKHFKNILFGKDLTGTKELVEECLIKRQTFLERDKNRKLSLEKIKNIKREVLAGKDFKDIAKEHNISRLTVKNLVEGKTYKDIYKNIEI